MQRPSPFLLHGWLAEWWKHYGGGCALRVHVARRDGRLLGALPLMVRRRFGIRVLEFIGSSRALSDMVVAAGEHPDVALGLAERMCGEPRHLVDLGLLPAHSTLLSVLDQRRLTKIERLPAPVLDLSAGWDTVYREKTSSKRRALHRHRRRQLAALGRVEVTIARTIDELEPALDEAFRLHAMRWEGRPDGSFFATPQGMRFHRDAIRALARDDIPRIVTLRVDGRAIAFHYYFALGGRMYVHRLAFDPALSRFSPGLINTLDTIEAAAAEGLTRVEFLGGDERYKMELADRSEPLLQAIGLARGARGAAMVAWRAGTIRLRLRMKRLPALRRFYVDGLAPLRRVAGWLRPRS